MPLDAELVAETRAWFLKVEDDLGAAADLFATPQPRLGIIAFLCQQAAEKSLKGFLVWHSTPFRKTHLLWEIGEQCVAIDPSLLALLQQTARLTDYAWKFRYPDSPAGPPEAEARAALALAHEVYQAILSRLPAEVRP